MWQVFATFSDELVRFGVPELLFGLVGAVVGWWLTERSARKARRLDWTRAAAESQSRLLEPLDDFLADAWTDFRAAHLGTSPYPVRPSDITRHQAEWTRLWTRAKIRLTDEALQDRIDAFDSYLRIAGFKEAAGDAPSADLRLQWELAITTARWGIAAAREGRGLPVPFIPTGPEWNWVIDHGPHEDWWVCIAAWIEAHSGDHAVLRICAAVRLAWEEQGVVPSFDRSRGWLGSEGGALHVAEGGDSRMANLARSSGAAEDHGGQI